MEVRSGRVFLACIGLEAKDKFSYEYDFGDDWVHDLTVEKALVSEQALPHPICMAGKRSCPPEDCGGTSGYEELLEAAPDPTHPRHKGFKDCLDDDRDPEWFRVDDVNICLKGRFAPPKLRAKAKPQEVQPKARGPYPHRQGMGSIACPDYGWGNR